MCDMCMCLALGGVKVWAWALPILEEHGGKWGRCFGCGGVGGDRLGPESGRVGWCYVCVLMAGICILC